MEETFIYENFIKITYWTNNNFNRNIHNFNPQVELCCSSLFETQKASSGQVLFHYLEGFQETRFNNETLPTIQTNRAY